MTSEDDRNVDLDAVLVIRGAGHKDVVMIVVRKVLVLAMVNADRKVEDMGRSSDMVVRVVDLSPVHSINIPEGVTIAGHVNHP